MMAVAARDEMTTDQLKAIADKGYYKGEEIVASEAAGIAVVFPNPNIERRGAGRFDKADFAYDATRMSISVRQVRPDYHFTGRPDGKVHQLVLGGRASSVRSNTTARPAKSGAFAVGA